MAKKKKKKVVKRKPLTRKKKLIRKKAATKKKALKRRPARKKISRRKPARKPRKLSAKAKAAKRLKEGVIGEVTHYFPKVRAAVVKLEASITTGDSIRIKGHTTDFKQKVVSMQINHVPLTVASKGDEIGLLVDSRVRRKDLVYKS